MRVLFVCSGNNRTYDIAPFIRKQGESLRKNGVHVDYFPIVGKGIAGYLAAAMTLRSFLRKESYDLLHAHFTLSGWASVLAFSSTPIVLSLMGDDAYGTYIGLGRVRITSRLLTLLTWLIQPFVRSIISKSPNIESYVYLKGKSSVIPNGVDTSEFREFAVDSQRKNVSGDKKIVLFLGNRSERRKNYALAEEAVKLMKDPDVMLINPYPVKHGDIAAWMNAADVLAFPSLMEGSPNLVKEAMACNCPIVATDTGDVRWVIGDTPGCYVSSFNAHEFSAKLRLSLKFSGTGQRTSGAQRIVQLGLDEDSIAEKIISIYTLALSKGKIRYAHV